MKKTILFLALGFFALSANSQTIKDSDVPPNIKESFSKLHPNTKVDKWEKEGLNYEVEFVEKNINTAVELGPNGQLLSTEVEMKVADLPKAVSDYCAKNMSGKKITEASKITAANGQVSYEAEVDEADYIFDANGTFVKKEVDSHDDKDDHDKK
ncbi:MAG: PepSY-like domain-containing protein [Bacteroidetes bacterium]|nr:PepSY-like domain-containing protein [Bacteroidota bacterium]